MPRMFAVLWYLQKLYVPLLQFQEFANALLSQTYKRVHSCAAKDTAFACALHFNKIMFGGHDYIKVNIRARIFCIAQIEHDLTTHDANTDCSNGCLHWMYSDYS